MKHCNFFILLLLTINAFAQSSNSSTPPINWQLMDWRQDGYPGISVEKAYNELLKDKKPLKKIVVAVIDCGLNELHPDLAGMEWTNKKEIPGNGIDDDKNGFVDDIHGWNFIGNMKNETLEAVREYTRLRSKYENITDTVSLVNDSGYIYWNKVVSEKNRQINFIKGLTKSATAHLVQFQILYTYWSKKLPHDSLYLKDVRIMHPGKDADSLIVNAYNYMTNVYFKRSRSVGEMTLPQLIQNFETFLKEDNPQIVQSQIMIKENDPAYFRKKELGDDPYHNSIPNYGNNNTNSTEEPHGTECAGVIAALRNNNIGINGIVNSVEIMPVRVLIGASGSDEWDKDIANGIRYAVDNGAQIINMSFGKYLSPQKEWVFEAMKYAEQKGVLLIAAAGNDAANSDLVTDYPSAIYNDKIIVTNLMKIGASSYDSSLIASFSNYGFKTVDVFAPGVSIYTTITGNKYASVSGTSLATPMVAGLAAFIWSYYPTLTYKQVKYCIEKSATPINILVTKPGTNEKVPFSSLSRTGGIVNAYNAILIADELK